MQLHVQVAGDRPEGAGRCGRPRLHLLEVRVVAERGDGVADRRVDGTAGAFGRIEGHGEGLEEERAHLNGPSGVGVQHLELGVVAEAAAGEVDGLELVGEDALGGVRGPGLLHHDGGRGADGAERAGRQHGLTGARRARHAEEPPEVTAGVDWLTEGADDELPVLPVLPLVPVLPVVPDDEEPPPAMLVLVEPDPDDPDRPLPDAFPAWSWDTTIPMATVAPVAARTAPRVMVRSRARALSLLSGVCG